MEAIQLMEEAKKARENAYVPYSKFKVGAALLTKDGKVYHGCNIENAAYSMCNCAERTAIFTALTAGVKQGSFKELHVMTSSTKTIGMPCFVCRQMISEVFSRDAIVKCYSTKGEVEVHTVGELCPYPFDESDLN